MSQFKTLLTSLLLASLVACTPEIPEESKTSVEDPIGKCLSDYGDKDLCLEQMKLQIEAKQAEIELQKLEEKSNSDAGLTATEALLLGTLLGQMTSNPYSSYNPSSSYYSPAKYKSVSKYHSVSSSPTYKPPVATPVTNVKSSTPMTPVVATPSVTPVKTNSVPVNIDKNTNVYGSVVTPVQSSSSSVPVTPTPAVTASASVASKTNVVPVTSVNKTESSVKAVTPTNTQTTNISKSSVPVTKPSTEKSSWFSKSSSSNNGSYSKSTSIRSGRR